jgi:hypothetical protein
LYIEQEREKVLETCIQNATQELKEWKNTIIHKNTFEQKKKEKKKRRKNSEKSETISYRNTSTSHQCSTNFFHQWL